MTEGRVAEITDEFMREMLSKSKAYTLVILKEGPNLDESRDQIVWEHGRRNFSLRADGVLSIVCPVPDDSEVCGMGIFDAGADEVRRLMDEDPGVRAGVFVYEVHPCRSIPGDALA
jgi:YCII-related domain